MRLAFNRLSVVFILSIFLVNPILGQEIKQTIRGKVLDSEARFPLIGVNVVLLDEGEALKGVITDQEGNFRLDQVPLGRQSLKFSYLGYKSRVYNNLILTSGKELILEVFMEEEAFAIDGVEVRATKTGEAQNEMAMVSARAFSVDETDRYAGSRGEPARMASNFAGVQGADDTRNDIVIRGNSPQGVLWQMEGINIPNPNHFAIPGTGGGPVSIINNKMLANSDFYTGAFPAEYGNGIAGVFDLKLRNGNNEKHEFSGMLGFLGTEIFGEGPLGTPGGASYMFTYRYSTLSLFSFMGIDIGTAAVPRYQDASFRIHVPLKNNASFSVFAIGGNSNIAIRISDQEQPEEEVFGENDRDQYFGSRMAVAGATYSKAFNNNTFLKATVAASTESINAEHFFIHRRVVNERFQVDSLPRLMAYDFTTNKYSGIVSVFKKVNARNTITYGMNNDLYGFSFQDSIRNVINPQADFYYQYRTRWEAQEMALLVQPYVQWKHKFSEKLSMVAGIHSQYFSLSDSWSYAEPRAAITYQLPNLQSLSLGTGLHSQIQAPYLYYYQRVGDDRPHNTHMDFTRSIHWVAGYDKVLGPNMRLKLESYYQHLYNIPIDQQPSSFSLVNTGVGFARFFPDELVNEGSGENYGIELTIEKAFSKGYAFLLTGALFESTYVGSDGVRRDTDFNGNYAYNALFTKEFKVGNNSLIGVGTNFTGTGGRRYGPADLEASQEQNDIVFIDSLRNTLQFPDYFRADLRINYRINRPKISHEIAIDLVNVFNRRNILQLSWAPNEFDPSQNPIREEYQLGRLPLFYYRIDF